LVRVIFIGRVSSILSTCLLRRKHLHNRQIAIVAGATIWIKSLRTLAA
jgi:hypothetical protein